MPVVEVTSNNRPWKVFFPELPGTQVVELRVVEGCTDASTTGYYQHRGIIQFGIIWYNTV